MYQAGEYIVYGTSGVCKVESVSDSPFDPSESRQYYTLVPIYGTETIYIPVDSPVYTRPVITKAEAEALIDEIPSVEEEHIEARSPRLIGEHYEAVLHTHDCHDLVQLIKTVYAKSRRNGRRVSQIDQRYRKRAEDLLHSELSVALGIPFSEVKSYISNALGDGQPQ